MILAEKDRKISVGILRELLANAYVLAVKIQNFHWNIVDSRFIMFHEFFAEQYNALGEAIDEIAERIRMLGEQAPGSMSIFLDLASVEEANPTHDAKVMLAQLDHDHSNIISTLRKSIDALGKSQDHGTVDFLIGRLRDHEKMLWKVKSHT